MSIYTLTAEIAEIEAMLLNNECPISIDCLKDTLEGLNGDYEQKVENYCKLIKNLRSDEEDLAEEIRRLEARKKSIKKGQERLGAALAYSMEASNKPKIKTPMFTIYGLKLDKLEINGDVPEEYKVEYVTKKNDEKAIKEALKNGAELGFARFIGSVSIR